MQSVIGLLDFLIRVIRVLVNLENSADLHSLISIDKQQQQQENYYASRRGFGRRVWD